MLNLSPMLLSAIFPIAAAEGSCSSPRYNLNGFPSGFGSGVVSYADPDDWWTYSTNSDVTVEMVRSYGDARLFIVDSSCFVAGIGGCIICISGHDVVEIERATLEPGQKIQVHFYGSAAFSVEYTLRVT